MPASEIIHTVKSGESLGKIAQKYGVSAAAIAHRNAITNPALIHPGQKLKIPAASTPTPPPPP
ncbi:LysM peptidoglycan-binding domain-containing protein, partial [Novosphingobium sp. B 225]|uniref:LysM peptidoglycan-binding domain-containing protein n=1 Tax=Novosphingobium sp. B 225 TaxID=1961849 RepID=UPI0011250D2E